MRVWTLASNPRAEEVVRPGIEIVRVEDASAVHAAPGDYVLLPATDTHSVEIDGLRTDGTLATWRGRLLSLSAREARLLYEIMRGCGLPAERSTLARVGWGERGPATKRNIDLAISRLRAKLVVTGYTIRSQRNRGYTLERDERSGILVIEDEPQMQRAFVRVLEPLAVDFAASLAEALTLVQTRRYAALIVDLGLPDGCGSSVIPLVQRWDPPPAVMIVTGRSDPEVLSMSDRFGVPYCTKPADPALIRSFAARAVGLA